MPDKNYLVTIYIPTYNRVNLLRRALNSVRQQTYKFLDIIIVDDCSTDETQKYIMSIIKLDERIRYINNSSNLGASASRNVAIQEAKGYFITGLDDDDYFMPDRIKIFIDYWKTIKSSTVLIFSGYYWKTMDGKFRKSWNTGVILKKNTITHKDILFRNYIGNQIFTTTKNFKRIANFDEKMSTWEDIECWYRLLLIGNAEYIKKFTYVIDSTHESTRISNSEFKILLENYYYFCEKHNFKKSQKNNLMSHFLYTNPPIFKFKIFFRKIILSPNLSDIKLIFKLIFFKSLRLNKKKLDI